MITKLYVQGYKSLIDFDVKFTKGINVLIGPNGVGKTNICQAMNLLASMPKYELRNMLNKFGGIGTIFHKGTTGRKSNVKKFTIGMYGEYNFVFENIPYELQYQYEMQVSLLKNTKLRINDYLYVDRKNEKGEFVPILQVKKDLKKLRFKVINKDLLGHLKIGGSGLSIDVDDDDSLWWLMPKISLVCHEIGRDILRIKAINIDPNIAREACDVVEPDIMLESGKYLSNALYSIPEDNIEEINSLMEDCLPCCFKIKPEFSSLSLKRYFTLVDKDGNKFFSSCLSDGTIKMLGLLVGVINQEKFTMIIEELENYLHPSVHRLMIDYLRETFKDGVCILTSHSETILNLINPEELILCRSKNNSTNCSRIGRLDEIRNAIEESGFGCGYHYVKGNLDTF